MFNLSKDHIYVIAEAGVNHNGDPALARKLVDVAAEAKADAVKFQLFNPEEIASEQAPLAAYQERSGESSQREMLQRLVIPHEEYRKLKIYAESKGLAFLTTPFDAGSADYLASIGVKAMKIPSGEVTNAPFMEHVANLGIYTIISTGMCDMKEVHEAVAPFQKNKIPFAILHCVSSYPAPADQINLRAMETLRKEFNVPVGYSDHTEGIEASVMAAALGAEIIEKHYTLDRKMVGPDHAASLEPDELAEMMRRIRDKEGLKSMTIPKEILGDGVKKCQPCEADVRLIGRRSVVLTQDVKARTSLTKAMIAIKRPGTGIAPKEIGSVIGKTLKADQTIGAVLTWEMLS